MKVKIETVLYATVAVEFEVAETGDGEVGAATIVSGNVEDFRSEARVTCTPAVKEESPAGTEFLKTMTVAGLVAALDILHVRCQKQLLAKGLQPIRTPATVPTKETVN